jgi:L-alanine-DL-glutamate epimerase-like enolase superfamily enzyme
LLLKVTTDQGLEGWGEAFGFRAVEAGSLAIDQMIAPRCIGRDAEQIGSLMLQVQKTLHVFRRGGPLFYALSAVDIALWDIAGLIRFSDPELVRGNVRRALDAGFRCLKSTRSTARR